MSLIEAFIFGLLQGLTEFFPVSSSAHLKIAKHFFHIEASESQIFFDLMCHLGTLIAILYFFRKEIRALLTTEKKKCASLFIATLPLVPCYFLLKPLKSWVMHSHYLGFCLMLTAGILFAGEKIRLRMRKVAECDAASAGQEVWGKADAGKNQILNDSMWIGIMQSLALIPGISRSAATISCARVLGWNMQDAIRFSFLLSIPTIIGGNLLELFKLSTSAEPLPSLNFAACFVGFGTALFAGLAIIRFAIAFLEKGNLKPFAWYCLGLGLLVTLCLRNI